MNMPRRMNDNYCCYRVIWVKNCHSSLMLVRVQSPFFVTGTMRVGASQAGLEDLHQGRPARGGGVVYPLP